MSDRHYNYKGRDKHASTSYMSKSKRKREAFNYRKAYFEKNPGLFGCIWFCSQCGIPMFGKDNVQVDHIIPLAGLGINRTIKILMFVDAENVSREQVKNYLAEARSMLQETDTFVGKCYGSKDVLGSMISFFLENGFDFIDTAVYAQAKKNLADMKIIVDSIWDILETFRGDIKAVYILSNDCDFNPLIYKLKSLDIVIKAASFDSFGEINSVNGLLRLLTVKKFLPIKKEFVTQSVYEAVSDAVKEERVDKTVILALVRDRYTILQKAVKAKYGFPMDNLSEKQLKCFSFWDFNRFLTQRGVTSSADLLKLFLTKVYGSTINDREISEVLKI